MIHYLSGFWVQLYQMLWLSREETTNQLGLIGEDARDARFSLVGVHSSP